MIMAIPSSEAFISGVRRLHRLKDAAYRDAWKKRGEVMSIMANIARKVDRLEYVSASGSVTPDESLLDTVVDLFVYSLKYQTYLADQDTDVAARLFDSIDVNLPYSDGPAAFDALLVRLDLTPLDQVDGPEPAEATSSVLSAFTDLEACFQDEPAPLSSRTEAATALINAAVILIGALRRDAPGRYRDFLSRYLEETA